MTLECGTAPRNEVAPDDPVDDGGVEEPLRLNDSAEQVDGLDGDAEQVDGLDGDAEHGDGLSQAAEGKKAPLSKRAGRALLEWVVIAVCAVALAMLIEAFFLQAFSIPSNSMMPTLESGDRVMVYKLGYRLHDVGRGDVIVFHMPDETSQSQDLIKRVIAVGGDTFEISGGRVSINDAQIDEPYLALRDSTFPKAPITGCVDPAVPDRCVVPEGRLLVLGDNREFSRDGRFFGTIDEDTVVGRAFMKYWPPNSFGPM